MVLYDNKITEEYFSTGAGAVTELVPFDFLDEFWSPSDYTDEHKVKFLSDFLHTHYIAGSVRDNNYIYKAKEGYDSSKPFRVVEPVTSSTLQRVLDGSINVAITFGIESKFNKRPISRVLGFDIDTKDKRILEAVVQAIVQEGVAEKDLVKSFSGSKGYHVDVTLSEFLYFTELQLFFDKVQEKVVRETGINPKKIEARGCNGQAYKLPFGVHPSTNSRCFLVDSKGQRVADYESELRKHELVAIGVIRKAIKGFKSEKSSSPNSGNKLASFESKYNDKVTSPELVGALSATLTKRIVTENELNDILDKLPSFEKFEDKLAHLREQVYTHKVNLVKALHFMKYGVHEEGVRNVACSLVMIYRSEYMKYTAEQNIEWLHQWINEKCSVGIFDSAFLETISTMAYSIHKNPNDKHLGKRIGAPKSRSVIISSSLLIKLADLDIPFRKVQRRNLADYMNKLRHYILAFYCQSHLHGTALNDYTFNLPYSILEAYGIANERHKDIKEVLDTLEAASIISVVKDSQNKRLDYKTVKRDSNVYRLADEWRGIGVAEGDRALDLEVLDSVYKYSNGLPSDILFRLVVELLSDSDRKKVISGTAYRAFKKSLKC